MLSVHTKYWTFHNTSDAESNKKESGCFVQYNRNDGYLMSVVTLCLKRNRLKAGCDKIDVVSSFYNPDCSANVECFPAIVDFDL